MASTHNGNLTGSPDLRETQEYGSQSPEWVVVRRDPQTETDVDSTECAELFREFDAKNTEPLDWSNDSKAQTKCLERLAARLRAPALCTQVRSEVARRPVLNWDSSYVVLTALDSGTRVQRVLREQEAQPHLHGLPGHRD